MANAADHTNIVKNFTAFIGEAVAKIEGVVTKDTPTINAILAAAKILYANAKASGVEADINILATIIADIISL